MSKKSHLQVQPGTSDAPSINPNLKRVRRKELSASALASQLLSGNPVALARAITWVESTRPEDGLQSRELLRSIMPQTGRAFRIGITGVPGVGKSTFLEHYGLHLLEKDPNSRIAILAIDPSSSKTGGSILGDKTRMLDLGKHPRAFIRPTASGGTLGGVARATKEAALLCEAAGYTHIFIETVGVGQSETTVAQLVDCFVFLAMPGTGDELQGMKKGIMEMADVIAINKSEGANKTNARRSASEIRRALQLFSLREFDWQPPVLLTSGLHQEGFSDLDESLDKYRRHAHAQGWWNEKRAQQNLYWFNRHFQDGVLSWVYSKVPAHEQQAVKNAVLKGDLSPFEASEELLKILNAGSKSSDSSPV